jgi:hypothetical protein
MLRAFSAILFMLLSASAWSQDLSGTWEGTEEGNYMKMVIVKVGDRYVGFTYDTDPMGGWCRANFAGTFNADKKRLIGSGQGMIAMHGTHVQCDYDFSYSRKGAVERLSGTDRTKGSGSSLFDQLFGTDDGSVELRKVSRRIDTTEYMRRYLVVAKPPARFNVPPVAKTVTKTPVASSTKPKPATPKPATAKPIAKATPKATAPRKQVTAPVVKTRVITLPKDSAARSLPRVTPKAPSIPTAASEHLLNLKKERRSALVQEIETESPTITIRVYDNGVPDGDTVSILDNNVVVADHRLVAVNYFEFTLHLDEGVPVHEITLIAHNLGSIPPNTASLTIIAGEERYRLTASTDLERNAVIRVRYKKPGAPL